MADDVAQISFGKALKKLKPSNTKYFVGLKFSEVPKIQILKWLKTVLESVSIDILLVRM